VPTDPLIQLPAERGERLLDGEMKVEIIEIRQSVTDNRSFVGDEPTA
jgi:hypothetical protein